MAFLVTDRQFSFRFRNWGCQCQRHCATDCSRCLFYFLPLTVKVARLENTLQMSHRPLSVPFLSGKKTCKWCLVTAGCAHSSFGACTPHICLSILDTGEKTAMCRNFICTCIKLVDKSKISLHVENFQFSPHNHMEISKFLHM